jgi:hypothetical protein
LKCKIENLDITDISYRDELKARSNDLLKLQTCSDNLVNMLMVDVINGSLMIPNVLVTVHFFCSAVIELLETQEVRGLQMMDRSLSTLKL